MSVIDQERPQYLDRAEKIAEAWRATMVARWHANPDLAGSGDTVGAHSGRAALLVVSLFPGASKALLVAALQHDLGEAGLGDVAGPAKRENRLLANALVAAEERQLARLGIALPTLSEAEAAQLAFVDSLDAFLWMRFRAPWLEQQSAWQGHRASLEKRALDFGLGRSCLGLL